MRALWLIVLLALALALGWKFGGSLSLGGKPDQAAVAAFAPAKPAESVPSASPLSAPKPAPESGAAMPTETASDLVVHALQDPQACLAETGKRVREQKVALHRWVDSTGIIHFSDQPPVGAVSEHRRIEVAGLPPVVVHAKGYDVNLPDFLEQRAISDAQAIERVLRSSLGVEADPGFALNIEFIAAPDAYLKRVGNPALATSAGAYSSRERTIYVRMQDQGEANFVILRHEITHALLHERVGLLPVTINEGLAGFFERIEVSGMGAQIALGKVRGTLASAVVSGDGSEELVDLLAREGVDFYAEGREIRYLRAFALIAVLMNGNDGRAALAAVLAAQRADSCRPVDAANLLDARYPGGLAALASDWAHWLRDPPPTVHAF